MTRGIVASADLHQPRNARDTPLSRHTAATDSSASTAASASPAEIYDRVKHAHHERGVRTPPSAQPPGKMLAPKAKAAGLWGKLTGRMKMKPPTGGVQLRIVATRRDVARAHAAGHASINASSTLQRDSEAHQDAQVQQNKMVVSIEICSTLNIAARAGTKLCCHMRVGDAVDPPATVPDGRVQSEEGTAGDPRVQWGCKTVIVVDDVATDCINCIITEEGGAPKLGKFSIGLKELVEIERTREATAGATKSWPLTAWRESWLTVKSPPPTLQLKAAWAPKDRQVHRDFDCPRGSIDHDFAACFL